MKSTLKFDRSVPFSAENFSGLTRNLFGNGRLFVNVAPHGGITEVSYWNRQHQGAAKFFKGDSESPWVKCLRMYAELDGQRYYLPLQNTSLYPFGHTSHCTVGGVKFRHQLQLLPDALVQRFKVLANPKKKKIAINMLHQEAISAFSRSNRKWTDMVFDKKADALICSCKDENPDKGLCGDVGLAQLGLSHLHDMPQCTTWIAIGCDTKLSHSRGYHERSKHYLSGQPTKHGEGAIFVLFAPSKPALLKRLAQLQKTVLKECDSQMQEHDQKAAARPQVSTGNDVLDSAFNQFPQYIDSMRLPDKPGAIRATLAGYFVWGWDGMTAPVSFCLANDPASARDNLRFFAYNKDRNWGIPHLYTTDFSLKMKGPFPAQAQLIADLYHYVATTGDMKLAKELMPTCKFILDHCRKDIVGDTGLVRAYALWPDFPEAMEETGDDISSMNNSLLYQGLRVMEYLTAKLGDTKYAKGCADWAKKLRAGFIKYLFDQEHGYFISSCDSKTLKPRKHYVPQAIFWITPFARELASHAPKRISAFMEKHLRTDMCLLTVPRWDSAWMADGNQIGATYPAADAFYLNLNKTIGYGKAIKEWANDVEWFWQRHTVPEAFTPEAINESEIGVDNCGCKQLQALTAWHSGAFVGMAGIDVDHEGLTLTPWGDSPMRIRNLILQGRSIDLKLSGKGTHIRSLKVNGKAQPAGISKLLWKNLKGKRIRIELVRTTAAPKVPELLRADGLAITNAKTSGKTLSFTASGMMNSELVIRAKKSANVEIGGKPVSAEYNRELGAIVIPVESGSKLAINITA